MNSHMLTLTFSVSVTIKMQIKQKHTIQIYNNRIFEFLKGKNRVNYLKYPWPQQYVPRLSNEVKTTAYNWAELEE